MDLVDTSNSAYNFIKPTIDSINEFLTNTWAGNENFLLIGFAILIGYWLNSMNKKSNFLLWILFSSLIYFSLRFIGIGG